MDPKWYCTQRINVFSTMAKLSEKSLDEINWNTVGTISLYLTNARKLLSFTLQSIIRFTPDVEADRAVQKNKIQFLQEFHILHLKPNKTKCSFLNFTSEF
jgi:hypothetical protein